jgi:hypothetical protein
VCGPLIVGYNWRVAYFQFQDNIKDGLYATVAVCLPFGQVAKKVVTCECTIFYIYIYILVFQFE